ncbi:PREDICTED: endogenous retrovirus group K member 11 Pol protein-like [Haliaeetus leucocephalus]|uniref:endogenous retrovirus group K member 11 Pol protein-like n=1 Tax=Haliaeetus leucocephalus TaxID=52644 RepID=UPI00053CE670|nr:PREDICTED: endogenous retrovirus group K member 11 Pol protein-like [Haliaeetus leucocephalus]
MDKPVWVEQWPMTEEKRVAVVELVQREVQMGHLEPSTSPWNTPVFVIKKKSGAWRLLHDLRAVNACLQDMGALQPGLPSPAIVPKGQGVIVIDIKDCFFSIPLHPGDRERFAFSIPEWNHQAPMQRYQWKVLPQGMKNSPTLCQIAVGKVLHSLRTTYRDATIMHYMDDILLSHQDESVLQHLYDQTVQTLCEYGLHISPNKTQMGPSVSYLGTQVTPRTVTAQSFLVPDQVCTLHDAQKLVGKLLWLRNFVPIAEDEMNLLYQLLQGAEPLQTPRVLQPAQRELLENIAQRAQQWGLQRFQPTQPVDARLLVASQSCHGVLIQNAEGPEWPFVWLHQGKVRTAIISWPLLVATMIMRCREACQHFTGRDPDRIVLPCSLTQWNLVYQQVAVLQGALAEFAGTVAGHEVHPCGEILHALPILPAQQVAKHPNDGRTIFTDASSKTSKAVCVWKEDGVWHQVAYTEPSRSVQFLEAKAVAMALLRWPTEPLNVVMDSLYVYKLLIAGEWALASSTEIAGMLLNALQLRSGPVFPIHVTSHSGLPGPLAEGNSRADQAAQALLAVVGDDNTTPARARAITLHRLLHCSPRGLVTLTGISRAEAKEIVAACPHCAQGPLWEAGVNPGGLRPNQIWQTDITEYAPFKPLQYLHVTVDTYSRYILATAHSKQNSLAVIQHWRACIAQLGIPQQIKTDNGAAYTGEKVKRFCTIWGTTLKHGIPHNSTGQAIVERAHRTLKTLLDRLREGEQEEPSWLQENTPALRTQRLLLTALTSLNQTVRGDLEQTAAQRHFTNTEEKGPYPLVRVRDFQTRQWDGPFELRCLGRGYACVQMPEGLLKWVPSRMVRPALTS